jgi:hypothetical protein
VRRQALTSASFLRDAKVGDLDLALVVDEDVCALDITVDDVSRVKVNEALEDLPKEIADERLLEGAIVVEERGDRSARDVLQEDVQEVLLS